MKEIKFAIILACLFSLVAFAKVSSPKESFKVAEDRTIQTSYSN